MGRKASMFERITSMLFVKLLVVSLCIMPNLSAVVDPIEATFGVCDVNKDDKLTMAEVQKDHCKETIEKLFALTNVTVAFLDIDANKDEIITKEEGQDAMKNFDRVCLTPGAG